MSSKIHPMYKRQLSLDSALARKSVFLLGPRQTGKSTFLINNYPQAKFVNLLDAAVFRELSVNPEALRQSLSEQTNLVIVDEIQKLPKLLDEIQLLIDRNKKLRFVLTGSSARKLRKGQANLLGGRALFFNFHPLVSPELGYQRILDRLNWGGLPAIIDSPQPGQDLNAYVGTYLKEEILAEAATRSIENFSRVLHFSANLNGQQINYTKLGNDAQVPPRTVRDYFDVMQDTLVAKILPPLRGTRKRKAVASEKFYFFDLGVARSLARLGSIALGSTAYGTALEHLVFLELLAYRDYNLGDWQLHYWRSQSGIEVDFVIPGQAAIEVKASARVSVRDLKGLKALSEEEKFKRLIVVCNETMPRNIDGIEIMPQQQFLRELWAGSLLNA